MNLATRNHSAGMGKKATFEEDPCLCRPIKIWINLSRIIGS